MKEYNEYEVLATSRLLQICKSGNEVFLRMLDAINEIDKENQDTTEGLDSSNNESFPETASFPRQEKGTE